MDSSKYPLYFEIKPKGTFSFGLRELKEYHELFYFFTWRDIKVKYKQTVLGLFWVVLQPLLLMAIFTLFLSRTIPTDTMGMVYPVFVFSGLVLWLVFSSGLSNASQSMVANASIIKKIYFPRLIIPASAILVAVFDFLMTFVIFIIILVYYEASVDWLSALWMWPLGLLITVLATLGSGCWLAALNIKYRDFRYVIPFLVQILLFLSPVIYPSSIIKNDLLRGLLCINPMHGALTIFRAPLSSVPVDGYQLGISLGSTVCMLIIGLVYFRKTEYYFADLA